MKFHQLKISNFGSIGDMVLPLEGQGLTLLLGRNEDAPLADSNGAGKSLPLDAFTWALWGSTIRGITSDEVIHNKKKKNCVVEVSFSDNETQYRVVRYRKNTVDSSHKPNDLMLYVGDEEASGSSMADTQDMLTDILGLDFTTFCAMMPGAGINVASMTDAEVKGLLEKLLRTQVLSKASDEARKRLRALSDEQLTQTTALKDINAVIDKTATRIDSLQEKHNIYVANSGVKRDNLLTRLETYNSERQKLIDSLQKEQGIQEELDRHLTQEETESAAIEKAKEISLKADLDFRAKLNEAEKNLAVVKAARQALEDQKDNFENLVGTCPTCAQIVDEDHRHAFIKDIDTKLSQKDADILSIVYMISNIKASWKASQTTREDLLQQYLERFNKTKELVALCRLNLQLLKEMSLKLETVEDNIATTEESLQEIESDGNPYEDLLDEAIKELNTYHESKDLLEDELDKFKESIYTMKFWVDSFSPQGLRSFMLEHITPILNSYAKTYSDLITDGEMEITFSTKDELKSGKTKEKFNIKVTQKHGGDSYASNSSGERARANLIIALALGELAAMRADKVIPFRFLDEPFESIDETGTEAIVNLLNQMRDKYNTVYVITHQDYLKQLFSNKFTVVKQNGFSTLEK